LVYLQLLKCLIVYLDNRLVDKLEHRLLSRRVGMAVVVVVGRLGNNSLDKLVCTLCNIVLDKVMVVVVVILVVLQVLQDLVVQVVLVALEVRLVLVVR